MYKRYLRVLQHIKERESSHDICRQISKRSHRLGADDVEVNVMPPGCAVSTDVKSSSTRKNVVNPTQNTTDQQKYTTAQNTADQEKYTVNERQNPDEGKYTLEFAQNLTDQQKLNLDVTELTKDQKILNMDVTEPTTDPQEKEEMEEGEEDDVEPEKIKREKATPEEIEAKKEEIINKVNKAIKDWNSVEDFYDEEKNVVGEVKKLIVVFYNSYFTLKKLHGVHTDIARQFRRDVIGKRLSESGMVTKMCKLVTDIYNDGYKNEDGKLQQGRYIPLRTALLTVVDFCDASEDVAKDAANTTVFLEMLKHVLASLFDQHMGEGLTGSNEKLLKWALMGSHNLAMYDANVPLLRSVGFVDALKPYLQSSSEFHKLNCLFALADLLDEKESEILQTNTDSINYLMKRMGKALKDKTKRSQGWSTLELGRAIGRLARNDANKKLLVEQGALPLLVTMVQKGNEAEQVEALNAIWVLAFDEENQKKIVYSTDPDVIELLTSLRDSSVPKIKKVCNGALWTLRTELQNSEKYKDLGISIEQSLQRQRAKSAKVTNGLGEDGHVMVSYQWGNQKTLLRISSELKAQGYKVWMDVDQMGGSTLQAMAEAVENASVVLICYSHKYKDSPNCRAEAEYAFQKRKKIVPLLMERGYKPDGWLGFIVGAKLFFEFSDKYPFELKFEGLVKELKNILSQPDAAVAQMAKPAMAARDVVDAAPVFSSARTEDLDYRVVVPAVVAAVRKWNGDDVAKWISKHQLSKEKFSKLTGVEIGLLIQMRKEAPQVFYQTLKEMPSITDLYTMGLFTIALEDLNI